VVRGGEGKTETLIQGRWGGLNLGAVPVIYRLQSKPYVSRVTPTVILTSSPIEIRNALVSSILVK